MTDGNRAVADAAIMSRALAYAHDFGMLVVQHAEEPTLATGVMNAGEVATRLGLSGIPAAAEVIMLERDLRLVELTLRDLDKNKLEQPKPGESDKPDQQPQQDNSQSGGGASSSQSQSQSGEGQNEGSAQEQQPLTKEQADQILSAIEQDERQLTRETLRKGQRRTSVTRDW